MTVSEIVHEHEWRRPLAKTDYAGGMTEEDIESIKADSAKLREKLRSARENGKSTAS